MTSYHAVPLLLENKSGLIVEVIDQNSIDYHGQIYFDFAFASLKRLAYDLAQELATHDVAALAITPGFMRTEAILEGFGATESNWREVAETNAQAKGYGFAGSETPCFVGRAVASLAADPKLMEKSGAVLSSWDLSEAYGFSDIDGNQPHLGRYHAEHFPHLVGGKPALRYTWKLEHNSADQS